jgi:hypothetical protein
MIPHTVVAKAAFTAVVVTAATEIATYEISPEAFSTVSVGVGALGVALTAVITMILNNRNNSKNREQIAQIAKDQAAALALSTASNSHLQTLEVRMDGRMDSLLLNTAEISEAVGVKKGLQQAADIAAGRDAATAKRDTAIVDKVADAVVERIGDAADTAALAVPGTNSSRKVKP